MALIKCTECGKQISDTVSNCPNCGMVMTEEKKFEGYKLIQKDKNKPGIGLYSVLFGIFIPIVGFILGIVGLVKKEKYSVYGIFISILMPILYYFLYIYILAGII